MTRTRQILQFVVAHPNCSLRQVEAAIPVDPALKSARTVVAVQLHQLFEAGKLVRTGKPGQWLYQASKIALVDKRLKTGTEPKRSVKAKVAAKSQPKPGPAAPKRELSPPPTPPANSPARASLVRMFAPTRRGTLTSDQIAADVAEFLRNGGRIQQLKIGESAQSLSEADEAYRVSRMRGRSKQQAERGKARKTEPAFDDENDDGELAAA